MYRWKRRGGYECSSVGDKRFSALFARLPDGRTIEEAWQLDCKGYRIHSNNWKAGKGKPPLDGYNPKYEDYKDLWRIWAVSNKQLMNELRQNAKDHDYYLSDVFASTDISQARALSDLLNEGY
ncbi:hypothetical protein AVT69_gp083 [Pseudomonas phage PhiPA3]|uniref:Uncharacterized protein 084 n=1 Tax=Pseudomonas phage PhiPA3 TaxID=998086 RepID=F8SJW3_BPPA3|nr:hypothetical protein AVT69_gp083 [Pseudomonas phage PhiPA3]AEH03508.1 hypothetical protein [Pseudomonas phage PhiPA3]